MKLRVLSIIGVLAIVLSISTPCFADTPDPDSTPTIEKSYWYRNLLETDDRLLIWEANIPYTTAPSTLVTETFYWELLDTDNVTVLGSATGYAYNSNGYGYNVYSMYFSAADAITWNQVYTLRLCGNPAKFDDPPQYTYPIPLSSYTSETAQAANQAALATTILQIAGDLDSRWGLSTTSTLLLETESGTVLSIYGESVFRGSVYGVQALAPAAFRFVIDDMDAEDRTWDTEYADNLTTQFAGTWIAPAKTAGGSLFGVGYDLTSIILSLIACLGLYYANKKITSNQWNALIDISIFLVAAPRIDLFPLSFTALLCAMAAIYTGIRVRSMIG